MNLLARYYDEEVGAFGSTPGGFVPAAATPAPTTMATPFAFGAGETTPAGPSTGGFGGAATSFGLNSTPAPTNTPGIVGVGGNPMATPNSIQGFAAGAPSFNSTPSFTGSDTATPSTNGGGAGAFSIGTGGTKKTPGRRIVKAKRPISFSPRMTSTEQVDASSSLATSCDDGEAVCYLCLDGGADEADQPLRRDCACRGTDAGFVHLACLTGYAAAKSKQAIEMNKFVNPWKVCPSCHQNYQNEFRIDIASKFVSFVRKQYPRDTRRQVESLYVKLRALDSMLYRLQPVQKREAGVTANVLLSLIGRMRAERSPLPLRYSQFEADAYNTHGRIALDEGTEESAKRAVVHFEKFLKVCKAIGNDEGIATAKNNIAIAKSKYEGGNNNEEVMKASQELYEMRVAELGKEDAVTIRAGRNYAIHLQNANRREEARDLLTKLLAMSKQVFGLHHNITMEVESELQLVNSTDIIKMFVNEN
jgi:hypothetical protein